MGNGANKESGAHDGAPERLYANHLDVTFNLSEVAFDFGQRGDDGCVTATSRLLTTPVHLVGFARVIGRTIDSYQQRFGLIPDPEGSDMPLAKH